MLGAGRSEAAGGVAHAELRESPAFDVISRPAVSCALERARLARKYFVIAWVHLAALFRGLLAGRSSSRGNALTGPRARP